MRTPIIFLILIIYSFFLVSKVSACYQTYTHFLDDVTSGTISANGIECASNTSTVWFVDTGVDLPIQLSYYFNLPLREGNRLRIYRAESFSDCKSCMNSTPILDVQDGGFASNMLPLGLLSRCFVVRYDVAFVSRDYQTYLHINFSAGEAIESNLHVGGAITATDLTISGNVGIGVTDPAQKLEIAGGISADSIMTDKLSTTFIFSQDFVNLGVINALGEVSIGNVETPAEKLHVMGNVKADTLKAINLQLTGTVLGVTNFDSVGVGLPMEIAPNAPLQVFQSQILTSSLNSYIPVVTFGGEVKNSNGKNTFNNRLWLRRYVDGGSDWYTASLHDGISIDNTYNTPGNNTRTWWERTPGNESSGGIQSWGDKSVTYMTLKKNKLGIGTDNPTEKLVLYSDTVQQTVTQYANTNTGIDTNKGFVVGIDSAGNGLIWHRNDNVIRLGTNASEHMRIMENGNIGMGTTSPTKKLEVNGDVKVGNLTATGTTVQGTIEAKKIIVTENVKGADFVFADDYDLPRLQAIEKHIKKYRHLPGIPSAIEMKEKGIDLIGLNIRLLQKVEELTLYIIDQNKQIEKQSQDIITLTEEINVLKSK